MRTWVAKESTEGWYWYDVAGVLPSEWDEPHDWASAPWVEHSDEPTGLPYYINSATSVTRWEPPVPLDGHVANNASAELGFEGSTVGVAGWADPPTSPSVEAGRLGWEPLTDADGNAYWHHPYLELSVWTLDEVPLAPRPAAAPFPLLAEWEEHWDDDGGAPYWFHTPTGQSFWANAHDYPTGQTSTPSHAAHPTPTPREFYVGDAGLGETAGDVCTCLGAMGLKDDTEASPASAEANGSHSGAEAVADSDWSDWLAEWDDRVQQWYWRHNVTEVALWEPPWQSMSPHGSGQNGWERHWDNDQRAYFWHDVATGESSWTEKFQT
jgi:hypothetical protein